MKSEFNNNDKAKEKTGLTETGVNLVGYGTKGSDGDVQPSSSPSSAEKQIPYPKSVFFIITNEFCERFSYYGMKAVLTLYLKTVLDYTEDKATVVYHVFSMLCYFTPIFGAMLADSFLGKFRTILYLSLVYAVGNIVLSLSSITPLQLPTEPFSLLGLLLIAIGTGGIKPCVSAFGGDQFVLPQQAAQLASYFSIFYFSINAGSLLSTIITPIFRQDIKCFDALTCYPLAFGVPAVLMIVSLLVFVIGYRWYTIRKPAGNITAKVGSCIAHAIREKSKSSSKHDHWLDYASNKFDRELIEDVKCLLRVLVLYIPLPVFWALFDQQGSRWTFQATRMDGNVWGYVIKPDQMQVLNPFLILAMIPIFDQVIYPALGKVGLLKKPLQRLTFGGVLAGVAFVVSGILELKLETTYAVKLSAQESHINFINDSPCLLKLEMESYNAEIAPYGQYILKQIEAGKDYVAKFTPEGDKCTNFDKLEYALKTKSKDARSYLISSDEKALSIKEATNPDILKKDGDGGALVKFMFLGLNEAAYENSSLKFKIGDKYNDIWQVPEEEEVVEGGHAHRVKPKQVSQVPVVNFDSVVYKLSPVEQQIELEMPAVESQDRSKRVDVIGHIMPKQGGNYLFVIKRDSAQNQYEIKEFIITEPNSIHMLWLVPQYVIITVAEVMFSVTGLQFAFSQAPDSMKSVLQAAWLLTVAFGNVIVVFIAEFKIFDEQSKEFFLYSGLMFVDMVIFAVLAFFYKPIELAKEKKDDPPYTVEMKENKMNDEYDP